MSQTHDPRGGDKPAAAYSVAAPDRRRRPAWLLPLLVLLGLVLLALLLRAVPTGRDKDDTGTAATKPSVAATAAPSTTAGTATTPTATAEPSTDGATAAATGRLVAGGQVVLPLRGAAGSLSRFTGETATADAVRVQSVPADEGFWVGSSATDRVWVQLAGADGESRFTVKPGDLVTFSNGRVVPRTLASPRRSA